MFGVEVLVGEVELWLGSCEWNVCCGIGVVFLLSVNVVREGIFFE